MADNDIRTISFDRPGDILAAIQKRETFEIGGCQGRMKEAVLFVERAIGGEGMTSRVYTKGRIAALIPAFLNPFTAIAVAGSIAAHNLATLNPDYEIMKHPIDKALRVSYVKDKPSLAASVADATSAVEQGVTDVAKKTASLAADTASTVGQGVAAVAHKTAEAASGAASSVAGAWDKYAPPKEKVAGGLVVGPVGALVLNSEEIETIGAKTLSAASAIASSGVDAAGAAVTMVKDHPGAVIVGAAAGIAAVAAAPFTGGGSVVAGASLATSLAGASGIAAGAAAVGAGASGAIAHAQTKKSEQKAYDAGLEKGMADSAVKIEELSKMLAHAAKVYSSQAELNEFIVSLASIGVAMAACDGPVSDEERACIEEYVIGMSKIALPQGTRDCLRAITEAPPGFEQALAVMQKFDSQIWPAIDGLLEVISEADGDVNESEQEFLSRWEHHKMTARGEGISNE